ncbi:MAG: Maf family protein [Acidimicrobiia bacterium]|nr:Maf family protein [Acidimicrobiia bacterium]
MPRHLILASGSPRRHQLLDAAGFQFTSDAPDIDETPREREAPAEMVLRLARAKAEAVRAPSEACVLGCDTTVVLEGTILGKPQSPEHAVEMLLQIAGRSHTVTSGYALCVAGNEPVVGTVDSSVIMTPISRDEAAAYVATGEPLDKAGSYAIQGLGRRFVDHYEGSFSNIMGLPMEAVVPALVAFGVEPEGPE